jgi:hypothetical protein
MKIHEEEILKIKTEEPLIKLTQNYIKKQNSKEKKEILKQIKKELIKYTTKKATKTKELFIVKDNEIIIDKEKLDYTIKLINKEEELYSQIEHLKRKKQKEKTKRNLEILIKNTENFEKELKEELNRICSTKEKITIIKKIFKKNKTNKFERLKEILEQNRHPQNIENLDIYYELKEKYYEKENLNILLGLLEKKCKEKKYECIQELGKKIIEKIRNIKNEMNKDIKKTEIKEDKYDQELIEYVYNRKNNYITQAINNTNNNSMFKTITTILKILNEDQEKKQYKLAHNIKLKGKIFKFKKTKLIKNNSKTNTNNYKINKKYVKI